MHPGILRKSSGRSLAKFNARAETVHKLPLFREAFAKRRCLIPATGFYEWQQREDGKRPYRFRRRDLEPFAFAGVWEFARLGGEDVISAAMIVGEPNPLVGGVHDRMPVMLMPEDYDRWLGSGSTPEAKLVAAALRCRSDGSVCRQPHCQQRQE